MGCTNKLKQSASEINAALQKYYSEIQNLFKEFEVEGIMPTTQQIKDAFNLRVKNTIDSQEEEPSVSFWEVFDLFVKECGKQNNWTKATYQKFAAARNHLKEFREDLTFEYFDEFGLNEYLIFLRDELDMRNSTATAVWYAKKSGTSPKASMIGGSTKTKGTECQGRTKGLCAITD